MPLDAFTNIFAGNPLDRASYQRSRAPTGSAQKLADPDSLAVVLWNGKPMVESAQGRRRQPDRLRARRPGRASSPAAASGCCSWACGRRPRSSPLDMEGAGRSRPTGRWRAWAGSRTCAPSRSTCRRPTRRSLATAKAMFEWRRRHRHCADCGQPTVADRRRLEARLPGLQDRALPAHRPGGDHAAGARRALPARPPGGVAEGHVLGPGRLPRAGRDASRRPARGRSGRRRACATARCATTPPSPGPTRRR